MALDVSPKTNKTETKTKCGSNVAGWLTDEVLLEGFKDVTTQHRCSTALCYCFFLTYCAFCYLLLIDKNVELAIGLCGAPLGLHALEAFTLAMPHGPGEREEERGSRRDEEEERVRGGGDA